MGERAAVGWHTYKYPRAFFRPAGVFFLLIVISFSAILCASFALANVVVIDSCLMRDVTRLRRRACRCAESRLRWRKLGPGAMVVGGQRGLENLGDLPSVYVGAVALAGDT